MNLINQLTNPVNKILIIGAHPDDAEFSTGRLLIRRKGKNSHVICMTDGRKGQETKKKILENDFTEVRLTESKKALNELFVENITFTKLPDQELISKPFIIDKLYLIIKKINPDYILIPPWEGAHPDHDAAHLFTVIATTNLDFDQSRLIEYGSYNHYNGRFNVQEFIPNSSSEEKLIPIPNEQKRWLNIMKIFKSQVSLQKKYLSKSTFENYRQLPKYDYSKLPYSTKQSEILRQLLNPVYPIVNKLLPKKDKLFYETWANINPNSVKEKLNGHARNYTTK